MSRLKYDVVIVGGGPSGSTTASLIKKYRPSTSVLVVEACKFPRPHVGESLLPPISHVLDELGCYEKIEAAGFPVKLGARLRWGKGGDAWDLDFIPIEAWENHTRPAPFDGLRRKTAFHVDRAVYDQLLLQHARELGVDVLEGVSVSQLQQSHGRIDNLTLADGTTVQSRYYVDASGTRGFLRTRLNIKCSLEPDLNNTAIYGYWEGAGGPFRIGKEGARIFVLTLPYGWLWALPLSATRTSIGLVVPSKYYKNTGLRYRTLYLKAINEEPILSPYISTSKLSGRLFATKDWSFAADKHYGPNWFLVGDAAGFADPILSAGLTLAQISARQLAFTLLELLNSAAHVAWCKNQFEIRQKQRLSTHIRFAQFWYVANSQLKDLKEHTTKLAQEVGLTLTPDEAWNWLAQGGFIDGDLVVGTGGFSLSMLYKSVNQLSEHQFNPALEHARSVRLNLDGISTQKIAHYTNGTVRSLDAYIRESRILPITPLVRKVLDLVSKECRTERLLSSVSWICSRAPDNLNALVFCERFPDMLEGLLIDGWLAIANEQSVAADARSS